METNTNTATALRAITLTVTVRTNVNLTEQVAELATDLARVTSYEADDSPYDEDDFYGDFVKPLAATVADTARERDYQIRFLVETAIENYLATASEVVDYRVNCEVDEVDEDFDQYLWDEFSSQHPFPTA